MYGYRINGVELAQTAESMRAARGYAVKLSEQHDGAPVVVFSGDLVDRDDGGYFTNTRDCLKVTASSARAVRFEALR